MNLKNRIDVGNVEVELEGYEVLIIQMNERELASESSYFGDLREFFDTIDHISLNHLVYIESDLSYDQLLIEIGKRLAELSESKDTYGKDNELFELLAVGAFNYYSNYSNVRILTGNKEYVIDTEKGDEL